jgi:type VI protein secretion system component Hcp
MIRRVSTLVAVGILSLTGIAAHASPENSTATLTCDSSPELSLTLVSFNLQVNAPTPPTTGSGAGKATPSPLTVIFASNNSFSQLLKDMVAGQHYSGCTLTQLLAATGSKTHTIFKWTLKEVQLTSLSAVGTNSSNSSSAGADAPVGLMQANFEFVTVEFTVGVPGT